MKTVLTIAGSDPSGGAGLQSDIITLNDLGVRPVSAAAALTAQNSRRVAALMPVPARLLSSQISTLLEELRPDAVKIGLAGGAANLAAIRRSIVRHRLDKVVLDTVLRSTSGRPLLDSGGLREMARLFPLAALITPNIPEAEALSGIKGIDSVEGMEAAAVALNAMGARSVLVKGGHLDGQPVDVLYDGRRFARFKGRRVSGGPERFHGTGCVLSAAIAAALAKGLALEEAVEQARAYLARRLRSRPGG